VQVKKQAKVYDVVVIGSGASGGMAAWNLTRQGVNVLLLDAGGKFDRSTFWTHVLPYEARERRARGEKPPDFYLSEKEQPIITPPGQPFNLFRVGGIVAGRPTFGGASRCAIPTLISKSTTVTAFPGRSSTRTSSPITTRLIS